MISAPDRRQAVELIEEAVAAGAATQRACAELQISLRTYHAGRKTMASKRTDGPKRNVQSRATS